MADWPGTLPQAFLTEGYKDTEPKLVVRTEMDAGPPKLRKRFTAGHRPVSGDMAMTGTQKALFRTFYLANCALEFQFPSQDADDSDIAEWTVVFMEEPTYQMVGPDAWKVHIELAILPE